MSIELALALNRIGRPRVLVVGDRIVDREIHCVAHRFAQEAPHCPVWKMFNFQDAIAHKQTCLTEIQGGAAAVYAMTEALGADAFFIGTPEPYAATKNRYFVNGVQQLRIDTDARPLTTEQTDRIAAHVTDEVQRADVVLVADYSKGVMSEKVIWEAIDGANKRDIPCIVDPHQNPWQKYAGARALKMNHLQASAQTNKIDCCDEFDALIITQGKEGISLAVRGQPDETVPCRPRNVVDVTGAGDMVLAALGVCIAGGMSWPDACRVANSAAGLKVCRRGAVPIPRANVIVDLLEYERIGPAELLTPSAQATRNLGGKIVWVNGCFDNFHAGHLHLLTEAKKQGDVLIVGVNTDKSVYSLKGPGRPIRPFAERAGMVAALACVDYVVGVESEIHLDGCIKAVAPDVLIKGSDWRDKPITGAEYAGRVHYIERIPGLSTTELAR